MTALPELPLPDGIRSGRVPNGNGLDVHLLEAGDPGRPLVVLLHGFPELAYSWRKVMPALAAAGFHAVAPDQRGYGRTTGADTRYDGDLVSYRMTNLVRDVLGLVHALGRDRAAAVIGHDFGSWVAAYCGLARPDVFASAVMMSAPFAGPPSFPDAGAGAPAGPDVHAALAALDPPRKHYQWHYSTREANEEMWRCPQGVHAFLRAYFHCKSGDWPGNRPEPLAAWTAEELARLPGYYVMERDRGMAETVAPWHPSAAEIAACRWLPDAELAVYASEFERTGFQGGLQWYRCRTDPAQHGALRLFAGRTLDVPSCFVAGERDWGIHQAPGALERMRTEACTRMTGIHLVAGAGHWVQQERPQETAGLLVEFLRDRA